MQPLVLDTNIVLDLFVFADEQVQPVREGLAAGRFRWLATGAMREELRRVLAYPQIVPRLAFHGLDEGAVLSLFDAQSSKVDAATRAPVRCTDPDDQMFVDLAVEHRAWLVSKDRAVLALRKRLAALGVTAAPALVT